MNLKSRKPFQIGAVFLALTMLASYVVYSQRQVAQTVAPGSKSAPVFDRTAIQQQTSGSDPAPQRPSTFVASGSKSLAPIFTLSATNSSNTNPMHVANTSASVLPTWEFAAPNLTLYPETNSKVSLLGLTPDQLNRLRSDHRMVASSSKSGAVFRPQDVTNLIPLISPHTYTFPAPLPHPNESTLYPTVSAATNTTASLKP